MPAGYPPSSVLTIGEACERLPWGRKKAAAWLRSCGLVRRVNGSDVVVWREVMEAITGETREPRKPRDPFAGMTPFFPERR